MQRNVIVMGVKESLLLPGPAKIIPGSKIGISLWVTILLRKYRFQIPVARILKNLCLNGLDLPAGTIGDGLKRLSPLFEPVYILPWRQEARTLTGGRLMKPDGVYLK
jgi:hypothetical protein